MNLVTDLLPPPATLKDRDAESALSGVVRALAAGDTSGLSAEQQSHVDHMMQAIAKIGSGSEIGRVSELLALAQFGAGSAGAVVADAFSDRGALPAIQSVMISRFLVSVVLNAQHYPHLVPGDMLRTRRIERGRLSWPDTAPVYRALLDRAHQAAASGTRDAISSPRLRKLFDRQRALTFRQIAKLQDRNPESRSARLNALDRFIVSLTIHLRLRATP